MNTTKHPSPWQQQAAAVASARREANALRAGSHLRDTQHRMGRRCFTHDYAQPGLYHITLRVEEGVGHPFGRVVGDTSCPDRHPNAPRVALSQLGMQVEHELLHSITHYYPMVEVQDYVIMPEHMHFILEVHSAIVTRDGKPAHLGRVIAGFKYGCDRIYKQPTKTVATNPATSPATPTSPAAPTTSPSHPAAPATPTYCPAATATSPGSAGSPATAPVAGVGSASRLRREGSVSLFAKGYVDVLPLRAGQLASQRAYIHNNPRQRLLRSQHALRPERGGIDTALGIEALKGYLKRECPPIQVTADKLQGIEALLLTMSVSMPAATRPVVTCDTYGSRALLSCRLLPVVCHRKDAARLPEQKRRCLDEAAGGAVLVSARISKGEQDIMDAAVSAGHPVVLICDNGFPELFHPSEARTQQCAEGRVLLVTPWQYHYRHSDDKIYVAYCKTMNCLAQALCHTKDSWWQSSTNHSALRPDM